MCPMCYGCCVLKNKSRHVKTKRHIQASNNKELMNNRFTNSAEAMQSYNHNVSDVGSSFENQSESDVDVETEINIIEDRFSPDSISNKDTINNHNIDSSKN